MRQAHGRGSFIDLLPARAARAVDIHFDILRIDLHIEGIVDFGHDLQRCKRGMPAPRGVERRHAHQPVHAHLAAQESVCVQSLHQQNSRFEARLVAIQEIERAHLKAVALTPVVIHAE